jgi:hypothetical protein
LPKTIKLLIIVKHKVIQWLIFLNEEKRVIIRLTQKLKSIYNQSIRFSMAYGSFFTLGQELVIDRVGSYYGFDDREVKSIRTETPFDITMPGCGIAKHQMLDALVTLDGPTAMGRLIIGDLFAAARPDLYDVKHSLKDVNYKDAHVLPAIRSTLGFGYGADSQAVHKNPAESESLDRCLSNMFAAFR